ncbi:CpsD/CapB family tyrosine-protein kinase [Hephaestia sp. GCM10023244]|uniref:CpsD/CapB family tyrosine-protein kinase n=1 Tax=unclassified Hephaestia TaxID=2631281 RepID=UPI002076FD09|nr:CpsD/CapB family tyrosine-protein kinase [Hephaestia sp. MAHUQ-44]MCM8729772.1 CpsD/CapB family tyrosine-protein kinase [Hephaestia sp. MAHUQ-44]
MSSNASGMELPDWARAPINRIEPVRAASLPIDRDRLMRNGIFGFEHLDPRAHGFILLRAQVLSDFYFPGGRILAVTSMQTGNGKSYIAANLAAALSRIHRTVLIDLDLRRPSIGERFGVADGPGIDDYLSGEASLSGIGQCLDTTDLTVFPVRATRENSSSLLASSRLGALFATIRTLPGAPICLVDTPPVLALDDIMLISRSADAVLLVIEEGRTTGREIAEAVRLLGEDAIFGSVLNKSMTRREGDLDPYYQGRTA